MFVGSVYMALFNCLHNDNDFKMVTVIPIVNAVVGMVVVLMLLRIFKCIDTYFICELPTLLSI